METGSPPDGAVVVIATEDAALATDDRVERRVTLQRWAAQILPAVGGMLALFGREFLIRAADSLADRWTCSGAVSPSPPAGAEQSAAGGGQRLRHRRRGGIVSVRPDARQFPRSPAKPPDRGSRVPGVLSRPQAAAEGRRLTARALRPGLLAALWLLLGLQAATAGLFPPLAAQAPFVESGAEAVPVEAVVTRITEAGFVEIMDTMYPYQVLEMALVRPPEEGTDRVHVRNSLSQGGVVGTLQVGDRVWLQQELDLQGQPSYLIATRSRARDLTWALVAFVVLVVLVSQWHGVRALLGLALSFVVVFEYIIPQIAEGASPVNVTLLGLGATMPVSYYLAHGLNRKATVALVGSLLALLFTGVLSQWMVSTTHLTGLASEEATFLLGVYGRDIDVKALLLAGILISILGVLDDITVAQSAVVEQLADANPGWRPEALFLRAMAVGRDHIASMVNTLVLVYAGSALPLLLLLTNRQLPLAYTLSFELVTEEVVRILVTSIGLVAAVPLTTILAAQAMGARKGRRARGLPPPPPYE